MIRYLFFDMDGTIVRSDGTISARTVQSVLKTGLPYSFVTARSPMEMQVAQSLMKPNTVHVCYNGALIVHVQSTGQLAVLQAVTIPFDVAQTFLMTMRKQFPNLSLNYYDLQSWYTDRIVEETLYEQQQSDLTPQVVGSFAEMKYSPDGFYKVMIVCLNTGEMERVKEAIHRLNFEEISVQQASAYYLEITNSNVHKASGVRYIKEYCAVETVACAGFGDGQNDLPMFAEVGTAVAMANSMDTVKLAADLVTKSNDDDGVAFALEQLLPLQSI